MSIRVFLLVLALLVTPSVRALDVDHQKRAHEMIDRAIEYLRSQQDSSGGWAVPPEGPVFPAITGLVVQGMVMSPGIDERDEAVARGVEFMLRYVQPDGGIYDSILAGYNTSICLSAMSHIRRPEAMATVEGAQDFLKSLQWSEESIDHNETGRVDEDHPFYGGVGYGSHGRPDMSNLSMMMQGLHDSGLATSDEAYARAVRFLERCQMDDAINDMGYADGSSQGGFIYATSENAEPESIGMGESKAGEIDVLLGDGTVGTRLRVYGSMTYAGFKSYLYADLSRDDRRVRLAYDWIRSNYTFDENPGVGMQGLYYGYVTFAKAMDAYGEQYITTLKPDGSPDETRDWANDLIDALSRLQNEDGSFASVHDRWMENNPVLITAYSLIALQHASR
ncbi:MAG: prenyltransferase/squalene oxidase repeat-containing protein [Planctomycetota bacterium]